VAEFNPMRWWRSLLAAPNTSPAKTLIVALLVALVCAVVVSVTAVTLRPLQQANLAAERQARMQQMLAGLPGLEDLISGTGGGSLDVVLVDLDTGAPVENVDPATFDERAAAADPATSQEIPEEADIAKLGRRANMAPVYVLRRDGKLALLILPVDGAGYESHLYGYLAIEGDLNTIAALTFYEQGETPGIGARITDPDWEALWPGTEIADAEGNVRVEVVRGRATEPYQVAAITGATRTSTGVSNLLQFWLGPDGFGPFLERLKSGDIEL
jgi:Na+-transporting NADH:ubiquinone oxidoreductase subunit C